MVLARNCIAVIAIVAVINIFVVNKLLINTTAITNLAAETSDLALKRGRTVAMTH
jgi:hypothetical protein